MLSKVGQRGVGHYEKKYKVPGGGPIGLMINGKGELGTANLERRGTKRRR